MEVEEYDLSVRITQRLDFMARLTAPALDLVAGGPGVALDKGPFLCPLWGFHESFMKTTLRACHSLSTGQTLPVSREAGSN